MRFLEKKNFLARVYRISFKSAFIISLPVLIFVAWMIAEAWIEYRRFATIACRGMSMPSFNTDILHLYLKDNLKQNFIRATSPEVPNDALLPTFHLSIAPESLRALNAALPESGKSNDYRAYVKYEGKTHTVKARYMGDNYWHWLNPQKSWRIRAKKTKLINKSRKLNIKNPRFILPFNQCIPQDLAKEIGLIAPRIFPVRFVQNGQYMGVYLFWDPIDESVIRRFDRMPGSIYSGDGATIDSMTGISTLWVDEKWWEKDGSRSADQKGYREDLRRLLEAVNTLDLEDYDLFCRQYFDQEMFINLFCLDSLVGTRSRDYHHNHKIYFDPYTGKYIPISWDMNNWHLRLRRLDTSANPLLNKWKLIPTFELARQRRLFALLKTHFSYEHLEARIDDYDRIVRPSLKADASRDGKFFRPHYLLKFGPVLIRPYTMSEYRTELARFKKDLNDRIRFLGDYLKKSDLSVFLEEGKGLSNIRLQASGNVGRLITGLKFKGTCRSIGVYRDVNRNGLLEKEDVFLDEGDLHDGEGLIRLREEILPGYRKQRIPSHPTLGNHTLEACPLNYNYIAVPSGGRIASVEIRSRNIITGEPVRTEPQRAFTDNHMICASIHPWDLPAGSKPETLKLGPGEITVLETMAYPEHVTVQIEPGTTFLMGKGVSFYFRGRVLARGTKENPIVFSAKSPEKPWGVFALQGKGASHSVFEHCSWQGGSHGSRDLIYYSGMVSFHDVYGPVIRNCTIGRNHLGDDGLHLAYCRGALVEGCRFMDALSDAFDADICDIRIASCRFEGSANDALDLMTSKASVRACVFKNAGDKGISVGEKTRLSVDGSVFDGCRIGMEIKDGSKVKFGMNIIRGASIGIHLYKKNWRYGSGGRMDTRKLFLVGCAEPIKVSKESRAAFSSIDNVDPGLAIWRETENRAGLSAPVIDRVF